MSKTFMDVRRLVQEGAIRISEHGYDELSVDDILAHEVVTGTREAVLVEDYPDYAKGPCVLVLLKDEQGRPLHVV